MPPERRQQADKVHPRDLPQFVICSFHLLLMTPNYLVQAQFTEIDQ